MLIAGRIAGGLLLALALLAALLDYRDLRGFDRSSDGIQLPPVTGPGPFHTYSHAPAARRAVREWRIAPEQAISILKTSLELYPLESGPWLGLARIEASQRGEFSPTLAANLEAAVTVQPNQQSVRWEASQVALHAGDQALAQHHLQQWVKGDARRLSSAMSTVQRWINDPDELVEALVPPTPEHRAAAMDFAFRQRDRELAEIIWREVAGTQTLDAPLFLTYADFLLAEGETDRLVALWSEFDDYYQPGEVPNGDFSREFGPAQGLNWHISGTPDGVRIGRDTSEFYSAPASLLLDFKGTHNLQLNRPRIRIPVQTGTRYRLSGFWRGQALTTRARPFVNVRTLGARWNEQIRVPGDLFDWQEFSVELVVPPSVKLIELSVRRETTNAFDRNIDGELWLDSFRLEMLPPLTDSIPDGSGE